MDQLPPVSTRLTPQMYERTPGRTKYISQVQIVHDVQQMKLVDNLKRFDIDVAKTQHQTSENSPKFGISQPNQPIIEPESLNCRNYKTSATPTSKLTQEGRSLSPKKKVIRITVKPEKVTYYRNGAEIQMQMEFSNQNTYREKSAQNGRLIHYQDQKTRPTPSLSPNKTSYWMGGPLLLPKSPERPTRAAPVPFSCLERSVSPKARSVSPRPIQQPSPVVQPATVSPVQLVQPPFQSRFLKRSASRKLQRSNFAATETSWGVRSRTPNQRLDSSLLQDPLTKKIASTAARTDSLRPPN